MNAQHRETQLVKAQGNRDNNSVTTMEAYTAGMTWWLKTGVEGGGDKGKPET